ncbi:hypothetical protein [Anaerorhabdus furcosa]|uniref:Uncharacterized protein n=1 Tax=Anaerorhabdus furcosa TaxID=118967 RepID=A0A1T4Q598_9FIRM|nr:hypothetical protein [Anaerorhabdus furcosa]SJZ98711.1 hypothetical protein SAMN02745191_2316 [Anaerorhabdus furcosa]
MKIKNIELFKMGICISTIAILIQVSMRTLIGVAIYVSGISVNSITFKSEFDLFFKETSLFIYDILLVFLIVLGIITILTSIKFIEKKDIV